MFRSVNIMFYVGAGEWEKGVCSYVRVVKYLSELKEKTEDYQGTVGSCMMSLRCIYDTSIEYGV